MAHRMPSPLILFHIVPMSAYLIGLYALCLGIAPGVLSHELTWPLPSGDTVRATVDFLFIAAAVLLYPLEALKSTWVGKPSLLGDLLLSVLSMIVCAALFFLVPGFGSLPVLIILCVALVDVLNGFIFGFIGISARDIDWSNKR